LAAPVSLAFEPKELKSNMQKLQ